MNKAWLYVLVGVYVSLTYYNPSILYGGPGTVHTRSQRTEAMLIWRAHLQGKTRSVHSSENNGLFTLRKNERESDFFFDFCRCLMWILNWIVCEPIWKRRRFRFCSNNNEPFSVRTWINQTFYSTSGIIKYRNVFPLKKFNILWKFFTHCVILGK